MFNYYTLGAAGTQVSTGAASARTTIPNDASGKAPKYIRIATTVTAYVKLGDSTVAATVNDFMVVPGLPEVLFVGTATNIAYLQEGSAGKMTITPLESG